MRGGYPSRELTLEEIENLNKAKVFLGAILGRLYPFDSNPLREHAHFSCRLNNENLYLRVKILIDHATEYKGNEFAYVDSYLMVDGFSKVNGKSNKSIESLQLPLNSALMAPRVDEFKDNNVIEVATNSFRLITKSEYNQARRT